MVRHGHNLEEAPLKLAPPYLHMDYANEHAYIEYCNASDAHPDSVATGDEDHVYVLIVGGAHYLPYVSPKSPQYLRYIWPISPYISPTSPLYLAGEHCMSYEIMAEMYAAENNDECVGMGHGAAHATEYTVATEVAPHHFVYGSCANNDWEP